jgi:hypothetical protein
MGLKLVLLHRLGVLKKMVLRRIFGPEREDVTRSCRRLYNEELSNFVLFMKYDYSNKSRIMCWTCHVEHIGEIKMHTEFSVVKR